MFRIFGTATVKETGEGVPNLVVAAYDTDEAQLDLDRLRTTTVEGGWGDRIGSVLTDTGGRFELSFDKADFQQGDQEARPDLLVMVYAPEDSQSATEPSPLTPRERLLHVSRVPRQDAGRTKPTPSGCSGNSWSTSRSRPTMSEQHRTQPSMWPPFEGLGFRGRCQAAAAAETQTGCREGVGSHQEGGREVQGPLRRPQGGSGAGPALRGPA